MVYIMGLFSGWWLGEADGRAEAPYLSPEDWHERLLLAGFNGCDSVTLDNERPYNVNANIVSRPPGSLSYQKEVVLLSGANGPHQLATKVEPLLQDLGYNTKHVLWTSGEFPTNDADVISFVDLDQPLLGRPSESDWTGLIRSIDTFQQATVLWLSHPAQISSKDPHSALFLGLARTVRSELATSLATLEAEDWTSPEAPKNIVDVLRKVQQGRQDLDSTLDRDLEYALIDGTVHVERFHWYSIPKALKSTATPEPDTKALMIDKRGLLGTLAWEGRPLPQLAADDVQVSVRAVGMNFTDVLIAMGVVHGMDALGSGFDTFGLEGAGIVSKIGADVKHVNVGDRVMILGTSSTGLATEVQRPGRFTLRISDDLTFEEAATMPSVYVTVLLGLVDKAQLEKDQSILIHAAAGGIGIATIQVARWLGADIYCTVGSDDKAQFLVRELGIPRERIFHSRDTSFYNDLMSATKGVGVDCVLNSVSGELLHTTWECVASNGCMVEIAKRDMIGRAKLALDKFEDNRTFFGIDVSRHVALKRTTGGRLMQMMLDLYKEGSLKPIHPITTFEAGKVEDAFRYMQQGTHIGKIVVTLGGTSCLEFPRCPSQASVAIDRTCCVVAWVISDELLRRG